MSFFSLSTRIQQNRSTENSSSCRGIRLANIAEGSSGTSNKKPSPSPFRAAPFELSRGLSKKSSLLDSDSDSDDDTDHIGALSGEGDSDMELDEPDRRSVSMATGITHDHPYAWALDGRVASLNEGNSMPGHIHVRLKIKTLLRELKCRSKNHPLSFTTIYVPPPTARNLPYRLLPVGVQPVGFVFFPSDSPGVYVILINYTFFDRSFHS